MELTEQEKRLIAVYRQADDRAQYDARRILENNKRKIFSVGQIISIADRMGKSVDELFSNYQCKRCDHGKAEHGKDC